MKKLLSTPLLYLLLPSVIMGLVYCIFFTNPYIDDWALPFIVVNYLLTLAMIVAFFKFKPCKFPMLFFSFPLEALIVCILDHIFDKSDWLQYLLSYINLWLYTLPFAVISLIIWGVIKLIRNHRYRSENGSSAQDEYEPIA